MTTALLDRRNKTSSVRGDHHNNYTSSTKNNKSDIGDWYWLVDDKDILIRICKSISFSDTDSVKSCGDDSSADSTLASKPRSIFDFLDGDDVKSIYTNIHTLIRSGKEKKVAFVWRCDTPTLCNHMYMVISVFPQNKNYLLYHSLVLRSYPHSIPFLANLGGEARRPSLSVCSFCFRVQPAGSPESSSVNEYYYQGGTNNVNINRHVCEGCRTCFNDFLQPQNITETLGLNSSSMPCLKAAEPVTCSKDVSITLPLPGTVISAPEALMKESLPQVHSSSSAPMLRSEGNPNKRNFTGISGGAEDSKRPAKTPLIAPSPDLGCLKILFVDDSRLNQCILGRMMKRAGMQISVASSGADAVLLAKNKLDSGVPFDIILMDCVMPGELDGFAATSKIREFSEVPIIAATGLPKDTWETSYKPAGMNDYLPKPFNMKDVLVLLQKWAPTQPRNS